MPTANEYALIETSHALSRLQEKQKAMRQSQDEAVQKGLCGLLTIGASAGAGYLEGRYKPEIDKAGWSPVGIVAAALGGAGILMKPAEGGNFVLAAAEGVAAGTAAVQSYEVGMAHRAAADKKKSEGQQK
jgi:hypothetical protein